MAEGDAFDILGLSARFDLEAPEIQRAYLARSAGLHPDIAAGDSEAQRTMAVLNDARRSLEDPERRARVLLTRLGGPGPDDRSLPPAFLMEMMEVREAVEDAMADEGKREGARRTWEGWAEERRKEAIAEIGGMFGSLSDPPGSEELRAIRMRLNAWRYIERLIEQLDPEYDPRRADFEM
jgi:molecular chaperone HscB